ncbi:uncharacterized protein [Fopius arisanus]|uniref:MetA_0 protein n=1 Tax=Fopius arisanus TaxID=64838 RepID=A0A0C9S086_9HYME|nr:PREDICTED: uncharacterized protein LOC105266944 [Fopius arisanus]
MSKILKKQLSREICKEFRGTHLEVLDFYGTETGFIWHEDQLLIFCYQSAFRCNDNTETIETGHFVSKILVTPKPIRTICSYSGRVFIVCEPTGIFKLSDKLTFAVLSKTGIGLGCEVHQVLKPTTDSLYLADKFTKNCKPLLQLFRDVNYRNRDGVVVYDLRQILYDNPDSCHKFCLISTGRKLYKLTGEQAEIVHVDTNFITDIVAIRRDKRSFGVGLITNNYLVLLLPDKNEELVVSQKLQYDGEIVALALHISNFSQDHISSFYTNGNNIYHRKLKIDSSGLSGNEKVDVVLAFKEKIINSVKIRGEGLLVLSNGCELTEFHIIGMEENERREFCTLKEEMIRNTNIIVDRICERARELEQVNKAIAAGQNKLERINAYAHKQKIQISPAVRIMRAGGRDFLQVRLEGLPQDSQVFVNVRVDRLRLFASKFVCDRVTTLEVPLDIRHLRDIEIFDLRIDLVATQCKRQLWCIMNNVLDTSRTEESSCQSSIDRENLFTAKLETLRSLMKKKCLDDVKLRYIKKSIRKD